MSRLNVDVVKQAIADLQQQGIKPTNANIVKFLGYGSFSTLAKIRKTHPLLFYPQQNTADNIKDTNDTLNTPKIHNTVHTDVASLDSIWNTLKTRIDTLIDARLATEKPPSDDTAADALLKQQLEHTQTALKKLQLKEHELLEQVQFHQNRAETLAQEKAALQAEWDEEHTTATYYKENYFRLIGENAQIKEGLWPTEETPDGHQKLAVKELILPTRLIPQFKERANKDYEGSQHIAISKLLERALEIDKPVSSKNKAPKEKKRHASNESAKKRLLELKGQHPNWSLTLMSKTLADEGHFNLRGKVFNTGTLAKWLNPDKY